MNYYDEILTKIDNLINEGNYVDAEFLIKTELNVPYIPKDIEIKLKDYLMIVNSNKTQVKNISKEEILKYLLDDEMHQLLAVNELNYVNLRMYIDDLYSYFHSDYSETSFALLVDSLIRQDIDYDIEYKRNGLIYHFNPSKLISIEDSKTFKDVLSMLEKHYLKDPSKYEIGKKLLYEKLLLALPINLDEINADILFNDIVEIIEDAFEYC